MDSNVDDCDLMKGAGDREAVVEQYISNCKKYDVQVDASVVISLLTKWNKLQPTKAFGEGAMVTLLDILLKNDHIKRLDLGGLTMRNPTYRGAGNGNSNARILKFVLERNKTINTLDLSNTGLDDDGLSEICNGISKNSSITDLDISYNHFGESGAMKLKEALSINKSIKRLDLSWNALGYNSINSLLCVCNPKGLYVKSAGNFVFEEILNSVSHGVGFLASIVGAIVLLRDVADDKKFTDYHFWACFVYSFSLMFLFISSCLYHSFFMMPTPSRILQILDHTGIYFLIAGTYTPFLLIAMHHDGSSRILLMSQWIGCFFGTVFSAFADYTSKYTSLIELTFFLCMGLGVIFVWEEVMTTLSSPANFLLLLGGAAYIFGIIFFKLGEVRPIYHTVWHLFVMLGAALHWFDIYLFIIRVDLGIQATTNLNEAATNFGEAAAFASTNFLETVEHIREML